MKKIFILLTGLLLINSGKIFSQNNENKADDAARIAITPQVSDQEIPASAKKMLMNKMRQIATKNGLSGDSENPFFVMDASVDVLSKEITPTAPPMHALNLQINFYIKGVDGNVYSETSYTTKGVGKNETKAYLQGLKNINTSKGQFKAFVERGKTKIIEYYNSQCDFVLSKGKALQKQGNNEEAIKVLSSVPSVCKECYDMAMEVLSEIEPVTTESSTENNSTQTENNSTQTENNSTQTATTTENNQGAATTAGSAAALNLGSEIDYSKIGAFPNAKVTYTKILKYSSYYLPKDKFGNFTFEDDKMVSVNGKIVRYEFEVPIENNPEYLLKITQPVLKGLGFTIVFAKNNKEFGASHNFRNFNGKLGSKYNIPWENNDSYILAKGQQNGKTVYISIFFVDFGKYTVIIQDFVDVE
jgi:hypothetical protein